MADFAPQDGDRQKYNMLNTMIRLPFGFVWHLQIKIAKNLY